MWFRLHIPDPYRNCPSHISFMKVATATKCEFRYAARKEGNNREGRIFRIRKSLLCILHKPRLGQGDGGGVCEVRTEDNNSRSVTSEL